MQNVATGGLFCYLWLRSQENPHHPGQLFKSDTALPGEGLAGRALYPWVGSFLSAQRMGFVRRAAGAEFFYLRFNGC